MESFISNSIPRGYPGSETYQGRQRSCFDDDNSGQRAGVGQWNALTTEGLQESPAQLAQHTKALVVAKVQYKKTQLCRFFADLRRTSICKDWLEGLCEESAQTCKFAHGASMLRRTPGFIPPSFKSNDQDAQAANMALDLQMALQTQINQQNEILRKQQQDQEEMRRLIFEQRQQIDSLQLMRTGGHAAPQHVASRRIEPLHFPPPMPFRHRIYEDNDDEVQLDGEILRF